ncbi:MAG TPA: four-helix bundle copper-binding protein [Anaerolineae bacterium]|nr:four-helix bundle copper-binding protein [Anaerolineae bacterium]HPL27671.1 four-helix bundle copper-binding protein [Anaerolineae bacterium]
MAHVLGAKLSPIMQQCIQDCKECGAVCQETISYCLQMGGRHVEPTHFKLMMDCAEICQISENYMLRDSAFSATICAVCAEVCARCADSCSQFTGDATMQNCAEVCRRCSTSCQRMVESVKQPAAATAL